MKKIMLVFVAVILFSFVGNAQTPDIAGLWTASNGSAIKISQNGDKVSWNLQDGGFTYTADGKWNASKGYFSVAIERKSKTNGCVTWLKVKFTPLNDTTAQFEESAMDQNCDLKLGYKNTFTFRKQD